MPPDLLIRDSRENDLEAIRAIYAHAVQNGTGTFEINPPTYAEMAQRREKILSVGLPYLVAEIGGQVAGFCHAGRYNQRAAYRFTIEDTVYVDVEFRRQGIGLRLLQALIDRCEPLGYRLMVAIIGDMYNIASIQTHKKCGFEMNGQLPDCGWKFDRWLGIVYMKRALGVGAATPPSSPDTRQL